MSRFDHRRANHLVVPIHAALVAGLLALMPAATALAQATTPPAAIGGQRPLAAQRANPAVAPDVTDLFTAPPTKVYKLSDGQTMTAAQIRAALDAQIAPKLKGPFVSARRTGVEVVDPSKLARESAAIIAETKAAASQSPNGPAATPPGGGPTAGRAPINTAPPGVLPAPGVPGATTTIEQGAQAKVVTSQVPCADRSPYVATFKGTITPGGVIGLTGQCFGTSGEIRISGTNSNFFRKLVPLWTDTALAATIPPDITGQIDQPVQVEVVRADGKKSADLHKVFIAAKDPEIEVPADLIVSIQCGYSAGCGNRQAVHQTNIQDDPPTLSGTDIWKVQLAKGWQLTTLSSYNEWGDPSPIPKSGFELGPPEAATFQYNWKSQPVLVEYNALGVLWNKTYSLAKYSIMVKAIGPRGVSMYPPK